MRTISPYFSPTKDEMVEDEADFAGDWLSPRAELAELIRARRKTRFGKKREYSAISDQAVRNAG